MASANYYAVHQITGNQNIYHSWSECEKAVKGQKGALFKKFPSLQEAREWLEKQTISTPTYPQAQSNAKTHFFTSNLSPTHEEPPPNLVSIYVDGSFKPSSAYAGWGWVAIQNSQVLAEDFGITKAPALSRNIDGEIEATIQALKWANEKKIPCKIYHDYQGISCWPMGIWKAKSEIALYYLNQIKQISIQYSFQKVKGHSGDTWNEYADRLAAKALG